jgi:hypothetical protein
MQQLLNIIFMVVVGYSFSNTNHELTTYMFRLLQNYRIAKSVNDLESLREPNYSCLSEWIGAKFNRGSNFNGLSVLVCYFVNLLALPCSFFFQSERTMYSSC